MSPRRACHAATPSDARRCGAHPLPAQASQAASSQYPTLSAHRAAQRPPPARPLRQACPGSLEGTEYLHAKCPELRGSEITWDFVAGRRRAAGKSSRCRAAVCARSALRGAPCLALPNTIATGRLAGRPSLPGAPGGCSAPSTGPTVTEGVRVLSGG